MPANTWAKAGERQYAPSQRSSRWIAGPAGTEHILVGAGDGPCAILMVGARPEGKTLHYPLSELAARYGASVAEETSDPREAYAGWGTDFKPVDVDWPPR